MKKLIPLLLIVGLLLAACGSAAPNAADKTAPDAAPTQAQAETPAPAPSEAPEPTEAPAETPAPASGSDLAPASPPPASGSNLTVSQPPASGSDLTQSAFPLLVRVGESRKADLDDDGTMETVLLDLENDPSGWGMRVRLSIDGVDLSEQLYADTSITEPDRSYWAITDVDARDHALEIAVQDWGPSDDLCTRFYRYRDGALRYAGSVEGLIETEYGPGDVTFDGAGTVHSYVRLGILQTWFAEADYVEAEPGFGVLIPEGGLPVRNPTHVKLLRDLTGYSGMYGGEGTTVPAGTEMDLDASDNYSCFRGVSGTGDWVLWFRVDPERPWMVETPEGYVDASEAIEGLLFAD